MGGIACYFQFDSSQNKAMLDDENLGKSLEYINHRGPDSTGTYFSACCRTGLGYLQLSVVGMDSGQQPLSDQENNIRVVVDGKLYNFKRIRSELQAKGYQFKTESNSEIALCLYQEYGLSFLDHLCGEFAVCIWDASKSRFILARDRFGIKPLYYTIVKGALLVASEIKAFPPLGWQPEWDVDSLMNNGVMFGCRTAFKSVNKLPPAYYMIASSAGSLQIRPFWCQKYASKLSKDTRTVESMVQGVQDLVVDAVKQRLEADVAVGIYLDNSVNTSCIAGIVNQIRRETNSKEKIKAFCFTIADDIEQNENMVVKKTAEFCDADLEMLQVSEEDLMNKFMFSKIARDQGYKVMLTGEGAGEHFAGHPHFVKDYLREADNTLPDSFGTLTDEEKTEILQKMGTGKNNIEGKNVPDSMLNNLTAPAFLETSFTLTQSFYSEAAIKKYKHRNPALTVAEALNGISRNNANNKCHPLHTAMSVQCTTLLPNYVLSSFSDHSTMAHSVETRLPFLDHAFCDYVNSFPPSVKIKADKGGRLTDKWILREAVKPYVTTEVYQGSKPPTYFALSSDTAFIKLLEKHLTKEKVERLGWANYNTVKAAKESYRITKSHRTYQDLLVVMSHVVLSEQFNVATARFEAVTFSKTKQPNSANKQFSKKNHNTIMSSLLNKIVATAVVIAPMIYTCCFQ